MSLILELPAETEAQLRQAAARAGLGIEQWIIEAARKEATQVKAVSLDEAAHLLSVSRAFILESVDNGALSGQTRGSEIFVLVDEKFEAIKQQQAETQAGLVEVARINSALGLYD